MFLCMSLCVHDGSGLGGKCQRMGVCVCLCVSLDIRVETCVSVHVSVLLRHAANVEALSTASFISGYTA